MLKIFLSFSPAMYFHILWSEHKFLYVPDFNILEFWKPLEAGMVSLHLVWLLNIGFVGCWGFF